MRYAIVHTPRTGSNALCDVLVQTGVAGMSNIYTAGFYVGTGPTVRDVWECAVERYFANTCTPNGVQGCKLGVDYINQINKALPLYEAQRFLATFNKWIIVSRNGRVDQAVSQLIARQTGIWQSGDKKPREGTHPVEFNRDKINWFIADTASQEAFWDVWFALRGIEPLWMTYEENAADWGAAAAKVLEFIGVDVPPGTLSLEPRLKRQSDPRKEAFIKRYKHEQR